MLVLLLHVEHVLLYGVEGCLRPHLVCPPHMDAADTGTQRQSRRVRNNHRIKQIIVDTFSNHCSPHRVNKPFTPNHNRNKGRKKKSRRSSRCRERRKPGRSLFLLTEPVLTRTLNPLFTAFISRSECGRQQRRQLSVNCTGTEIFPLSGTNTSRIMTGEKNQNKIKRRETQRGGKIHTRQITQIYFPLSGVSLSLLSVNNDKGEMLPLKEYLRNQIKIEWRDGESFPSFHTKINRPSTRTSFWPQRLHYWTARPQLRCDSCPRANEHSKIYCEETKLSKPALSEGENTVRADWNLDQRE